MITNITYAPVEFGNFAGVCVNKVEIGPGEQTYEDVYNIFELALSQLGLFMPKWQLRPSSEASLTTLHHIVKILGLGSYSVWVDTTVYDFTELSETFMQQASWISVIGERLDDLPMWACSEYIAVNPSNTQDTLLTQDRNLIFTRGAATPKLQFIPQDMTKEAVVEFLTQTRHTWQIAPKSSKKFTHSLLEET